MKVSVLVGNLKKFEVKLNEPEKLSNQFTLELKSTFEVILQKQTEFTDMRCDL